MYYGSCIPKKYLLYFEIYNLYIIQNIKNIFRMYNLKYIKIYCAFGNIFFIFWIIYFKIQV